MAQPKLYFDPDDHPDSTLKAFIEFKAEFVLRYDACYPDPPKVSLDSAIQRWKLGQVDPAKVGTEPTLAQYDQIVEDWRQRDMVAKFLGLYSSKRMFSDWQAALPSEVERKSASWALFVGKMEEYYKPTENSTLKHYQFRTLSQSPSETFTAFANRVEKEAKHCHFKCESVECGAESTAIRDQILIGLISDNIREEALKKSWDLLTLRKEGMQMESASKSAHEIAGDSPAVSKLGKYSMKNIKNQKEPQKVNCFRCGAEVEKQMIYKHSKVCPAKKTTCRKCGRIGHYQEFCKNVQPVNEVDEGDHETDDVIVESYSVNIFRVKASGPESDCDFKTELAINGKLDIVLADTGAKVSVCGMETAKKWNLLEGMEESKVKIKPYKSKLIPTVGASRCSVSFGGNSVPVLWHIIRDNCEPVLAGVHAKQLGIIKFRATPEVFKPVNCIKAQGNNKQVLHDVLQQYPSVFKGVGKMKNYTVKLLAQENSKPVAEPPRRIQYHLVNRVREALNEMMENDVIEEHPQGEHAPWTSNVVVASKDDGEIRITMDAKNVNKTLLSSNFPIPRQEDLRAKLGGMQVFSKLDLKSAYWQLELDQPSRSKTTFHCLGKLYRYKRLVMGIKSAQGELNAALQPLFSHLDSVHVIHDDIIMGTLTANEHVQVLKEVLEILKENGLTLNAKKCVVGVQEVKFWGLVFGSKGVSPDPDKVEALNYVTPPKDKKELVSFLCMMQANAEFIEKFAVRAAKLRELTHKNVWFKWTPEHQRCFEDLISAFRKDTMLRYFDVSKKTFIKVDAHKTGLSAMLCQGKSPEEAKPVALASRATSKSEKQYPQLDLEAASIDFGLRRFREYLVGSPEKIIVITDHKPLLSVFNGRRKGSIRSQRIKLNHQDILYEVTFCKGKDHQPDYLSRHSKPLSKLPVSQRKEPEELNNLLYMLHVTPVLDQIGIGTIARETGKDKVLKEIQKHIRKGEPNIPKKADSAVQKFSQIYPELMITGNGIIFKDDRIVLPENLQGKAMELAHRGSHTGQSGIERRLRFHFFFHDMYKKTKQFLQSCEPCTLFTQKKTKEPITPHEVPLKCWDTVSVDLYGPLPSSKHVVVVQDLSSRYPVAKLVNSTKADQVLPVLEQTYDLFGNPRIQVSDNGPPFSSKKIILMQTQWKLS